MWKSLSGAFFLVLLLSGGALPGGLEIRDPWYVSLTGNDTAGDGSWGAPFRTVQRALNAARDGDEIVVLEGRHSGPGNRDLDFLGKAVTVRSRDPESNAVLRRTILDATGGGGVARFSRDEGPGSMLAGFTLIAGDPAARPGRGVPGFFTFSAGARPALRRLRVVAGRAPSATVPLSAVPPGPAQPAAATGPPVWSGLNPFHQPAATTDYHGSGDADLDGRLGSADLALARRIARAELAPNRRADVDGSGRVDEADVRLLAKALAGDPLPGRWDRLDQRAGREAWIDRVMALDRTNQHTYAYWWQCLTFAVQTFIHGAFYRKELIATPFDGGPTTFNLPIYYVSVSGPSYGHGINAVLVGEDPLDFSDWRFLEPQTDQDVSPGMWDMPYGTRVDLLVPTDISSGGAFGSGAPVLQFQVEETGAVLVSRQAGLRLRRGQRPHPPADNTMDLWHPRIVPAGSPRVLFERARDGMEGGTDLYLADLPVTGLRPGTPLLPAARFSRLLDVTRAADGQVHLLWYAELKGVPGVFHGRLDLQSRRILGTRRISEGVRSVRMGRLVVLEEGEVHAFWLESKENVSHPYSSGIYWNRREGGTWKRSELLVPFPGPLLSFVISGHAPQIWTFDVAAGQGEIWLAWAGPADLNDLLKTELRVRYRTTEWSEPETLETGYTRGVALVRDTAGDLHLFDWQGSPDVFALWGDLRHRTLAGASWTLPRTLDRQACCVAAEAGPGGTLEVIWERQTAERSIAVRKRFAGGSWSGNLDPGVAPGENVCAPTIAVLPAGRVVVAWSSLSGHGTGLRARALPKAAR